ncbi:Fe-S cluster assembly ATPase SufC [Candidatus Babeliales bacterium]|nr:Fe-S cluster assembly ATPase SufC [Candidatus Babeliales bacterium]
MLPPFLDIKNLSVTIDKTEILKDLTLAMPKGETHAIMGPNGSGKSTLALTLMGHPKFKITGGSIIFENEDLTKLPVYKRAQAGIFLAFQHPYEIEGVTLRQFLYQAYQAKYKNAGVREFEKKLVDACKLLNLKPAFVEREINVGLSGGEKKQAETLQLAVLQPKLAILDEIDSGLDIDALKRVCNGINAVKKENPEMTLLVITHYPRILHYLEPHAVHVMREGAIVQSGTKELALELEARGYESND